LRPRAGTIAVVVAALLVSLPAAAAIRQQRPGPGPLFAAEPAETFPTLSQRSIPPLESAEQDALVHARSLRQAGQAEAARKALLALLATRPHHPLVLSELAVVYQERRDWRSLESLARTERSATRDTLLLTHELVLALERLNHPREAAEATVAAWVVEQDLGPWAEATLIRLASTDARGVREPLRRAARQTSRPDLAQCAARLEWHGGDPMVGLELLRRAERDPSRSPLRWDFATELMASRTGRDSTGAIEVLLDLAADDSSVVGMRLAAARRVWQLYGMHGAESEGASRLARALRGVPVGQWGGDLLLPVVRALREAGLTAEARRLIGSGDAGAREQPEIRLENALNEQRDGITDHVLAELEALAPVSPEAAFRYAEALFFAGRADSALVHYQNVAHDPQGPFTGAALERTYLIEEAQPSMALPAFGRLAYERWRGASKRALALADSLYRALPHGTLWAQAALALASEREALGQGTAALAPLLAVADSLPADQAAPLARQRAGDVLRTWYKDDARALEQYEEFLARYPKAWNAPEVRRVVETLRRGRRF